MASGKLNVKGRPLWAKGKTVPAGHAHTLSHRNYSINSRALPKLQTAKAVLGCKKRRAGRKSQRQEGPGAAGDPTTRSGCGKGEQGPRPACAGVPGKGGGRSLPESHGDISAGAGLLPPRARPTRRRPAPAAGPAQPSRRRGRPGAAARCRPASPRRGRAGAAGGRREERGGAAGRGRAAGLAMVLVVVMGVSGSGK